MTVYKEKQCLLCKLNYVPTSPKQKYCDACKEEGRKIADRVRDKKRSRKKNNYVEYNRVCRVCGIHFKTFYSKKHFCGSNVCDIKRVSIKNKKYHLIRDKECMKQRGQLYYKENKEKCCLQKAIHYRKTHDGAKEYIYGQKPNVHTYEYVKSYIEDRGYKLISDSYINNNSKIELICSKGHLWQTTFHGFQDAIINGRTVSGARCITCYLEGNYVSRPEQMLRDYFSTNFPDLEILYNDRKQIYPKELDLFFPDQGIAVEVCGLYWHSEDAGKKPNYHYNKMMACYEKGIRLITVFEDEIYDKFDIVMSRIKQALGLNSDKIFARKCIVKKIDKNEANLFLDENHIQGRSSSLVEFGLLYNDALVAVATAGKVNRKHTSTGDTIELKRFCTLNNTVVVGGASKLFKAVVQFSIQEGYGIIKSYCDRRFANLFNPIYENMGFILSGQTKYSPHYIKNGTRYRNFSLRKTPEERLTGKTESILREEQGYDRLWDCGHLTYVYNI